MSIDVNASCPCGSGMHYGQCCGPFISGERQAGSALALMRARYTAYATGAIDFIMATQDSGEQADRESTESWSKQSEWLGLEILTTTGGEEGHEEGTVEFVARYRHKGEEHAHHEVAEFRRAGTGWTLSDGQMKNSTFRRTTRKVKPNEPCPCGSGKKYKKCCRSA